MSNHRHGTDGANTKAHTTELVTKLCLHSGKVTNSGSGNVFSKFCWFILFVCMLELELNVAPFSNKFPDISIRNVSSSSCCYFLCYVSETFYFGIVALLQSHQPDTNTFFSAAVALQQWFMHHKSDWIDPVWSVSGWRLHKGIILHCAWHNLLT